MLGGGGGRGLLTLYRKVSGGGDAASKCRRCQKGNQDSAIDHCFENFN
jgi:hypothetical protein